jgi:hypothetical protein
VERTIRTLPVQLTRDEWEARARHVARLSDEIADADRRIESVKEEAKSRVKDAEATAEGLRATQRTLSRVVRENKEDREVECAIHLSRRERTRTVIRMDTGETVESRPLSDAEARVDAKWELNWDADLAELVHADEPDHILERRQITDAERQAALPGTDADDDSDDADDDAPPPPKAKRGGKGSARA